MRMLLLFICLLTTGSLLNAADSLQVLLNTSSFVKGDTLEFACTVPDYAKLKLAGATLNIWIEDVEKTKRWKFPKISEQPTIQIDIFHFPT